MESTHQEDYGASTETLLSVLHYARLNPEFEFAGMKGVELELEAYKQLADSDVDGIDTIESEITYKVIGELKEYDTHRSLSCAIEILQLDDLELLADLWYRREDLEQETQLGHDASVAELVVLLEFDISCTQRYTSPVEYQIALGLCELGFEDTDRALLDHLTARLQAASTVRPRAPGLNVGNLFKTVHRQTLEDMLTPDEAVALAEVPAEEAAYHAVALTRDALLAQDNLSDTTKSKVQALVVAHFERSIQDLLHVKSENKNLLPAVPMILDLLATDPDSKQYAKWARRIKRHFKLAELTNFLPVSFSGYRAGQIETALHSLGELTIYDTTAILADYATRNSTTVSNE